MFKVLNAFKIFISKQKMRKNSIEFFKIVKLKMLKLS